MERFNNSASGIRDAFPECPICTEHFDKSQRIPRQMTCCNNSICQPCLKEMVVLDELICPLCRQTHFLPKGIESLPKETEILKVMEHMKKKKIPKVPCTHCPDRNIAIGKCNVCNINMCKACRLAHPLNHKITLFEETKVHPTANTALDGPTLSDKLKGVRQRIEELSSLHKNIEESKATAISQINTCFDYLIDEIQQRREMVISEVSTEADKEQNSITTAVVSHQVLEHKLETIIRSQQHVQSSALHLLDKEVEDLDYNRRGISFTPAKIGQLISTIRSAGLVQTVTFTPRGRPSSLDASSHGNTIKIEPVSVLQEETDPVVKVISCDGQRVIWNSDFPTDQVIVSKEKETAKVVVCPHLHYDHNTASFDLIKGKHGIAGILPLRRDHVTGCRIHSPRTTLLYPPITAQHGTLTLYQVKCNFRLKETIPVQRVVFMVASLEQPVDMCQEQTEGFHFGVGTYNRHSKDNICFYAVYNDKMHFRQNLGGNVIDEVCSIDVYIIMNKDKHQIHIVDVRTKKILTTVFDVMFDRPLWTMVYTGKPEWTDFSAEILSGNRVEVDQDMCEILAAL